jgi:Lipopolysaccharide-assembly
MKKLKFKNRSLFPVFAFCLFAFSFISCNYKFNEAVVDQRIKTAKIVPIENVAQYVNPQLTPNLTDRLRQKINNQTKLSLTNNDNANIIISGKITDYTITTSGVTSTDGKSQASINRLSVTVQISLTNQIDEKDSKDISVSRQFDFPANRSQQQAEAALLDEMVRNLTDEIFNQLFSNW